MPDTQRWSRA